MRLLWVSLAWLVVCAKAHPGGEQPLSRIAVERTVLAVDGSAQVKASPLVLGMKGETSEWVDVEFFHPNPSGDDWIGVFSPADFSSAICEPENERQYPPALCTAPIKYQFANFNNGGYNQTGKGYLKLQLINQRAAAGRVAWRGSHGHAGRRWRVESAAYGDALEAATRSCDVEPAAYAGDELLAALRRYAGNAEFEEVQEEPVPAEVNFPSDANFGPAVNSGEFLFGGDHEPSSEQGWTMEWVPASPSSGHEE